MRRTKNSHKNWNNPDACPANIKRAEMDHMPREVATEMLCAPKARSTNRERKIWFAARATHWEGTTEPKPLEVKVANRLKCCKWEQLTKWLKRTLERRRAVQGVFQQVKKAHAKLEVNEENKVALAIMERQLAGLDLQAVSLDAFRDALDSEIDRRESFIKKLKRVSPSVAQAVGKELCQ
jgi:hypothetical protein